LGTIAEKLRAPTFIFLGPSNLWAQVRCTSCPPYSRPCLQLHFSCYSSKTLYTFSSL